MTLRIYLASSWRNEAQPIVLAGLRDAGHVVYDFRNPGPGDKGFGWSAIDPAWRDWTPAQFRSALAHPIAERGHRMDHDAMEWCDACVLLLPAGSSAHLEAGWCAGRGKSVCVYAPAMREPELMYRSLGRRDAWGSGVFFTAFEEVAEWLAGPAQKRADRRAELAEMFGAIREDSRG